MASDHVRLLGATISSDLSLDRHVANVSSTGFYWLRQLRRVRRSLDMDSATTLVHAFVSSRVDYCNILLAGAPKVVTDRLQLVLHAVARVVSSTHMYIRTRFVAAPVLRAPLARCAGKSSVQTRHRNSQLLARPITAVPLRSLCTMSDVSARQHLRSATRRLGGSTMPAQHTRPRAFSVAGPSLWNSLPDSLRDSDISRGGFRRLLKTYLFTLYGSI